MTFQLSKEDQRGKTELLAHAREKHTVVCARIDAFNAIMDAARASIAEAWQDYAESVDQLHSFARRTEAAGNHAFAAQPADWRRSAAGAEVQEWIECYGSFKPQLSGVEVPMEIDTLDEAVLTDFEELPDAP